MVFTLKQFSLEGRVALVTGGSRGIGKAIALGLANAGANVAVTSRKLPDLEEVAAEIRGLGRKAVAVSAHLGRMEEIAPAVSRVVGEFGKIDILVNNAATNPTADAALDSTERAWDAVMNLNLKGLFFLSQAVARLMREQGGGAIVNIASVEGMIVGPMAVYGISKAGVIHASRIMAKQWAPHGIRVNVVAPALTRTRFAEYMLNTPEVLSSVVSHTPMGRIAEPDEIVGAVVYLASDAAAYVTGQTLAVDGGRTLG